eukprot:11194082-Lingulodinium_polyedra.AAC.1
MLGVLAVSLKRASPSELSFISRALCLYVSVMTRFARVRLPLRCYFYGPPEVACAIAPKIAFAPGVSSL